MLWRRPQQQPDTESEQLLLSGSGLAEAVFPAARSVLPLMPSPWDDPEFYSLGLHMGPPPPPPSMLPGGAAAEPAVASDAAAVAMDGGMLWQRADSADGPAAATQSAADGVVWQRDLSGEEAAMSQQDAGMSAAADADAAAEADKSANSGAGSQLHGKEPNGSTATGSLKLPPRPMRVPIIPSQRMRTGGSGPVGVPEGLADDPAVLDNLEDEAAPQRRPLATADGGRGGER